MSRFTFDVKALATVYVEATSEEEARAAVNRAGFDVKAISDMGDTVECHEFNLDGEAILVEREGPAYVHDYEHCAYIETYMLEGNPAGTQRTVDVYVCPGTIPSVIQRFSHEPSNYWSMPADILRGLPSPENVHGSEETRRYFRELYGRAKNALKEHEGER